MKTTCEKVWPVNLLQVSDLTFDPCLKVKWCHHTKMTIYLLYIVLGLETHFMNDYNMQLFPLL